MGFDFVTTAWQILAAVGGSGGAADVPPAGLPPVRPEPPAAAAPT